MLPYLVPRAVGPHLLSNRLHQKLVAVETHAFSSVNTRILIARQPLSCTSTGVNSTFIPFFKSGNLRVSCLREVQWKKMRVNFNSLEEMNPHPPFSSDWSNLMIFPCIRFSSGLTGELSPTSLAPSLPVKNFLNAWFITTLTS